MAEGPDNIIPNGTRVRCNSNSAMGVTYPESVFVGTTGKIDRHLGQYDEAHPYIYLVVFDVISESNPSMWFYPEELDRLDILIPVSSSALTEIPRRLRVTISRGDEQSIWQCEISNGPIGDRILHDNSEILRSYIPKAIARHIPKRIWNRYNISIFINQCIVNYNIDPQILVDAITQVLLARMARDNQGVFTSEIDSNSNNPITEAIMSAPALMAIGNMVYSLTPQGAIKGSRGMALIRKRVVERSKMEAAEIKRAAMVESVNMIQNAEARLAEIRAEGEREIAGRNMRLPQWVIDRHIPVMPSGRDDYPFYIAVNVHLKVDMFQSHVDSAVEVGGRTIGATYFWNAISPIGGIWDSIGYCQLWLPINFNNNRYKYNGTTDGFRVSEVERKLPHIGKDGCCMELQGMPDLCDNFAKLDRIRSIINRGMKVVNLNSLLTTITNWHRDVINQVPLELKTWLREMTTANWDILKLTANEIINDVTEVNETFTNGIIEARVAAAADTRNQGDR